METSPLVSAVYSRRASHVWEWWCWLLCIVQSGWVTTPGSAVVQFDSPARTRLSWLESQWCQRQTGRDTCWAQSQLVSCSCRSKRRQHQTCKECVEMGIRENHLGKCRINPLCKVTLLTTLPQNTERSSAGLVSWTSWCRSNSLLAFCLLWSFWGPGRGRKKKTVQMLYIQDPDMKLLRDWGLIFSSSITTLSFPYIPIAEQFSGHILSEACLHRIFNRLSTNLDVFFTYSPLLACIPHMATRLAADCDVSKVSTGQFHPIPQVVAFHGVRSQAGPNSELYAFFSHLCKYDYLYIPLHQVTAFGQKNRMLNSINSVH